MKRTELIMGMPITVEVPGLINQKQLIEIFDYFRQVDARFSPYRANSELSKINTGLTNNKLSTEMQEVLSLCEQTKKITGGYFDINKSGQIDTSGLVKGWAIDNAAKMLIRMGYRNYYVEAGGDIQVVGNNEKENPWRVGIRNPFNIDEIVKVLSVSGRGVATSGTYIRGEHIYNPMNTSHGPIGISSLTVIGPNIFEADRFATAAFAMGEKGIFFIDSMPGFEAYQINDKGVATLTKGFETYVAETD
jgi:thiamine biosynthesis lipoprotein